MFRLGVVEENRGNQGLVVGETEKLLVGDVGGEPGGLEEVGGGEVLAVGDVDAENGVVERALRVREEKRKKKDTQRMRLLFRQAMRYHERRSRRSDGIGKILLCRSMR